MRGAVLSFAAQDSGKNKEVPEKRARVIAEESPAKVRKTKRIAGQDGGKYETAVYAAQCSNLKRILPICTDKEKPQNTITEKPYSILTESEFEKRILAVVWAFIGTFQYPMIIEFLNDTS
ncbi:hypothetical protein LguiA_002907 [Lonicera macranthoides]